MIGLLVLIPGIVTQPAPASPANSPIDAGELIERQGLPHYRVPVNRPDEEYLLFYDAGDTPDGFIDDAYLVDDGHVVERILLVESHSPTEERKKRSKKYWFHETVEDLRETVEVLKQTRDSMNRNVHTLPVFNQFDEIEVISDELTFRVGTRDDPVNTTVVYEPRKDWVSLTVRVPFGG